VTIATASGGRQRTSTDGLPTLGVLRRW